MLGFKKIIKLFPILVMLFLLSACNNFKLLEVNVEKLMSAPHMTVEQNDIYNAVKEDIGKDFKYIYPEKGDYTSAYILNEENGNQRALVFYKIVDEEDYIKMAFLKKDNGKWKSFGSINGEGYGIDRVIFANLDDNTEGNEIIIGYSYPGGSKLFSVYRWQENVVEPIVGYSSTYVDFVLVNGENKKNLEYDSEYRKKDIVIIYEQFGYDSNIIALLSYNNGYIINEQSNEIALTSTNIANMVVDQREDIAIIFVDEEWNDFGYGGNQKMLITETFSVVNQKIENQLEKTWDRTIRPYEHDLYSNDIDGDGMVEIPADFGAENIRVDNTEENPVIMSITWMEISEEKDRTGNITLTYKEDQNTIRNMKHRYHFFVPSTWWGKVYVEAKEDGDYVVVGDIVTSNDLITLYAEAFNPNAEIVVGYDKVLETDFYSYYIDISDYSDNNFYIDIEEVKNRILPMVED